MPNSLIYPGNGELTQEKVDERWSRGDFLLNSADGLRFRVESCQLFSASHVFRDASTLSDDSQRKIEFTDSTFETAAVIHAFLALTVHGDDLVYPCGHANRPCMCSTTFWVKLVLFMEKYDCRRPLNQFTNMLQRYLQEETISPLTLFVIGAVADDKSKRESALRHPNPAPLWRRSALGAYVEGADGRDLFNPTSWPFEIYQLVPTPYSWALGRAWLDGGIVALRERERFSNFLRIAKAGPGGGSKRPQVVVGTSLSKRARR